MNSKNLINSILEVSRPEKKEEKIVKLDKIKIQHKALNYINKLYISFNSIEKADPAKSFLEKIWNLGFPYKIKILGERQKGYLQEIASSPDCQPLIGLYPTKEFFNGKQKLKNINHDEIIPLDKFIHGTDIHPICWDYDNPKALILIPQNSIDENNKKTFSQIIKILEYIFSNNKNNFAEVNKRTNEQEFVSYVSHQLKVPLASLRSGIDIIKKQKFGQLDWHYMKIIEIMEKETQNMNELIYRLLDLARYQSQISPQLSKIHILRLIQEVINSLQNIQREKFVELRLICSPIAENFYSDPVLIKQIVLNLLHNAYKYSPMNGRILLILEYNRSDSILIIRVVDEGPGVSEDNQSIIFNKFSNKHEIKSEIPSTGLGLAICKKIIEILHGDIYVESPAKHIFQYYGLIMKDESLGSAFTVHIPIEIKEDNNEK